MNSPNSDPAPEIICRCCGATKQQIRALMDQGFDTLEKISRFTGACSGCGACDTDILAELDAHRRTHVGQ